MVFGVMQGIDSMAFFSWRYYVWKNVFNCHYFPISLEYQSVVNFAVSSSMSGKVAPSDISQAVNEMRIRSQLKWNS
jgi:hypothetical protein